MNTRLFVKDAMLKYEKYFIIFCHQKNIHVVFYNYINI